MSGFKKQILGLYTFVRQKLSWVFAKILNRKCPQMGTTATAAPQWSAKGTDPAVLGHMERNESEPVAPTPHYNKRIITRSSEAIKKTKQKIMA